MVGRNGFSSACSEMWFWRMVSRVWASMIASLWIERSVAFDRDPKAFSFSVEISAKTSTERRAPQRLLYLKMFVNFREICSNPGILKDGLLQQLDQNR